MKYLQSGGFQNQPMMRLTLGCALALLAGFWVTNLALYLAHMNLHPASVVAYYRGSEADFRPPRSALSMLEVTHMHLPMFALVLLLLTHLLIFAPLSTAAKRGFILAAFGSALLSEAAGWMTRFWHPAFAWLKVVAFVAFQASLGYLIVALGLYLARGTRARHRRAAAHAPGVRHRPGGRDARGHGPPGEHRGAARRPGPA